MVRPVPAGRRGSCCTPYSRLQEEIDNVETIAVTANNTANNASQLAQQAMARNTFDDVNVNGDLNVYGNIIQQGAAYETHAQHVFSTDDYIVMRDGALVGLAQGDYSGFQVKKYDGVNDGRLVIDQDGVARVGDVGDEQPLLTRDESADMVNAAPLVWDAADNKAVSGVFPVSDPGVASINGIAPDADNDFTIEAGTGVTITSGTNKITIDASGGSGEWVHRTTSNSWADLFTQSSSTTTALYTCLMIYRYNDFTGIAFITKGQTFNTPNPLSFKCSGCHTNTGSNPSIDTPTSLYTNWNEITSSTSLRLEIKRTSLTIDFVNETFSSSSSNLQSSPSKSNVEIWYLNE